MADAKLTALTAASALAAADLFYVSQSAASRKATGTQLLALVGTAYVPLAGGTMTGALTLPAGAVGAPSLMFTGAGATTGIFSPGADRIGVAVAGVTKLDIADSGVNVTTNLIVFNNNAALYFGNAYDIALFRDAAATLAQRNGTTQQIFRLYNTYTDSSNYERLTLTGVAGTSVNITAETLGTGGDNLDIVLTPAGTGGVVVTNSKKLTAVNIGTYAIEDSCTLHAYNAYGLIFEFGSAKKGYMNTDGFKLAAANYYGWVSDTDPVGSAADTALFRNAAGVVEVTNGTAGTWRDLKLRNLLSTGYATIDSGTLTASAPALSITQTWNQGATAFTGALINITNTASSSASRPIDVQIAGASIFAVRPDGYTFASAGLLVGSGGTNGLWDSVGPHVRSTGSYSWAQSANATDTADLFLYRDAAASLALRNGTAQQSFSVYNTYTDSSNYERLKLTGVAGTSVNITAETLGTGADNLDIVLTPAGTGSVKIPVAGLALSGVNANFLLGTTGTSRLTFAGTLSVINKSASADLYFGESTDTGAYFFRGTGGVNVTGAFQVTEMTAPSAPATNSVRIYAEDNGSGKTRLMALFATGAAQQLAIEP